MKKYVIILIYLFSFYTSDSQVSRSDFKYMIWYSEWCQRPYRYNSIALPCWIYDWEGVDIIVHFCNPNIDSTTAPYWRMNSGYADSTGFFLGGSSNTNYVDSLIKYGHNAGAEVIMTIQCVYPQHIEALLGDSAKIEVFCENIARWCEDHNYGGVDWNYEGYGGRYWSAVSTYNTGDVVLYTDTYYYYSPWVSLQDNNINHQPVEGAYWTQTGAMDARRNQCERFIRRLRVNLNSKVTGIYNNLTRPWLSITANWDKFMPTLNNYLFSTGIQGDLDKINVYQGTAQLTAQWGVCEIVADDNPNAALGDSTVYVNWHPLAVYIGSDTAIPYSLGINTLALANEGSWVASTQRPSGVRAPAAAGWPKSMITPAAPVGGGGCGVQSDTLFGCIGRYLTDSFRWEYKNLLSNGGQWGWDEARKASYIYGTATSNVSLHFGIVYEGEKFFAPIPDSANWYWVTDWLIKNDYGGIAPFDVSFDVDNTLEGNDILPGHKGIARAIEDNYGDVPVLTISPGVLAFGSVYVGQTSAEQTFTVSGINLTPSEGNITVTALTGYEVSLSTGTGFGSSVEIPYDYATLSETTVYIRFKPTEAQSYNGNQTISGGGDTDYKATTGAGEIAEASTAQKVNWKKP